MKKIFPIVFMLCCFPVAAFAEKIGILDINVALSQSDAAKQYEKSIDKTFGRTMARLKQQDRKNRALLQKINKEGPTMSQEELSKLQLEYKQRTEALALSFRQFQDEKNASDQKWFESMRPVFLAVLAQFAKENDYDMILDRSAVLYIKPSGKQDITRRIIAVLNKHKS